MPYRPSEDQISEMMSEPMAAGPGEVGQDPMQAEVLGAAEDLDAENERSMELASPTGSFSMDALNDLVDSLNKVLPMFGESEVYPSFAESIDGELPTEFVSALMMVGKAAQDSGLERLSPDLEIIQDDSGLDKVARQIDTLADNQTFKTFLKGAPQAPPTEEPMPAEPMPAAPMPTTEPQIGPAGGELDNLLAARA